MTPIMGAAIALFGWPRQLKLELRRAKASFAERRLIDQAKALLMKRQKMNAPQAYCWLQRRAMNTGRRIAEIANKTLNERSK